MNAPIDVAIPLFSGYTQKQGNTAHIGWIKLLRELQLLCKQWPTVEPFLYPWDADVADIAECLWRLRPNNGKKQVYIGAGYSYGGDRLNKLWWELGSRNDVSVAVSAFCDPVCRLDWLPGVLAATGTGKIYIPSIVKQVWWYRQRNPRWSVTRGWEVFQPAGHEVVAVKPYDPETGMGTKVSDPVVVNETHSYIDNDASFRESFVETVKDVVEHTLEKPRKCRRKS